jgi:hypothetical protein
MITADINWRKRYKGFISFTFRMIARINTADKTSITIKRARNPDLVIRKLLNQEIAGIPPAINSMVRFTWVKLKNKISKIKMIDQPLSELLRIRPRMAAQNILTLKQIRHGITMTAGWTVPEFARYSDNTGKMENTNNGKMAFFIAETIITEKTIFC